MKEKEEYYYQIREKFYKLLMETAISFALLINIIVCEK